MPNSNSYSQVTFLTESLSAIDVTYKTVRNKEGRWLSDEEVRLLPRIAEHHPLRGEWNQRAWMWNKFAAYLAKKRPQKVLDIGCGNGWMTSRVSRFAEKTLGIDVGKEELEQAARCFGSEMLQFACCNDWSLLPEAEFDLIYFTGSFHYFECTPEFWTSLFRLLAPNGEIHILETRFYLPTEVQAAKKRTQAYYENLGVEVTYYKHLRWDQLPANYELIYRPNAWNKIYKSRAPFPWVRIKNKGV